MKVVVDCLCPVKQKHAQDTIVLVDKVPFRQAVAIRNEVGMLYLEEPGAGLPDFLGVLQEAYLHHCIESWTLRDKAGPIPPNRENIDRCLLSNVAVAMDVADKADDLYRESVMLPLVTRALSSSQGLPTAVTTSRTTEQSTPTPTPLRPSSTSTTRTADTAEISSSPGGVSKLSQKTA